jgi:signal transduction histidine kinase/CheY-like chemotaxis protein
MAATSDADQSGRGAGSRARWLLVALALTGWAMWLLAGAAPRSLLQRFDDVLLDLGWRRLAIPQRVEGVVWVDIDAASLRSRADHFGSWPLRRDALALLLRYLKDAHVRAVVLDLVLADARPDDEALVAELAAPGPPVVLAAAAMGSPIAHAPSSAHEPGVAGPPIADAADVPMAAITQWSALVLPTARLREAVPGRVGMVSLPLDPDGRLRRLSPWHNGADGAGIYPVMPVAVWQALETARAVQPGGRLRWPLDSEGRIRLPVIEQGAVPRVSFAEVVDAALGAGDGTGLRRRLAGQIVVIGSSAALDNRVMTPAGQFDGAQWLAAAVGLLGTGHVVRPAPSWADATVTGLALLPGLALVWRGRTRPRLDLALHMGIGLLLAAAWAFTALARMQAFPIAIAAMVLLPSATLALMARRHEIFARAEALQREREIADAANRAKSEFLSRMSHELRTPLNGVVGACQLLRSQGDDPQRRADLLALLERSSQHLLELVDGVLQLGRIEAGALELADEDFDLIDALDSVVAAVAPIAQAKGLVLACIVDPAIVARRRGDVVRMRQILMNLIGNAVKFTSSGQVVLRVMPGPNAQTLKFSLEDTGVGIDPAALGRIFEPFRQADRQTERRFGGSGLGLAISARLVQAMGGRIDVQSAPGKGTQFQLSLPLPVARQQTDPQHALALEVVVIEPQPAEAEAALAILERMGCTVHLARDAAEWLAVSTTLETRGVMPWLLVALDDPGLVSQWRQAGHAWPPRCIGMRRRASGHDTSTSGADPHQVVRKPLFRGDLARRMGAAPTTVPGALFDAASTTPAIGVPVGSRPVVNDGAAAGRRVLVVEDDPVNQIIVEAMLSSAGWSAHVADDGATALRCLQERAFDVVLMDCHLPDIDGLEVTRQLRSGVAGPQNRRVPVVALTANAFEQDRRRCMDAGMDDFLTKPVVAADLERVIARWARPAEH